MTHSHHSALNKPLQGMSPTECPLSACMLDYRGPVCPVYRQKQAGVLSGSVADEENWVSDTSGTKIPLSFLKRVGIFEIPPTSFDQLTLTAQHLSFVEFFASVGIILSSDLKGSL